MNWTELKTEDDLNKLVELSSSHTVLIFKHSTRCSISDAALNRIERNWKEDDNSKIKPYYLDLIAFRNVSNLIAQKFGVEHQSPQLLIIKNGDCTYHQSHYNINYIETLAKA